MITLLGCGGVRWVCQFLELSGLSAFVASSYGVQQQLNVALEQAVVAYGRTEQTRLGALMVPRSIALCQDETFHPEICLVGIEPVSNFIVLERYAPDRTAESWTQALDQALKGLPVRGHRSDQRCGQRLVPACEGRIWVRIPVPDLFHVQHEVAKAMSLNLARQVKRRPASARNRTSRGGAPTACLQVDAQRRRPQNRACAGVRSSALSRPTH